MANRRSRRVVLDWYSVSVDAVQLIVGTVVVVLLLGIGYYGYQRISAHRLEQRAAEWVAKPAPLLKQLRAEHGGSAYRDQLDTAEQRLNEARAALAESSYRRAIDRGKASFKLLQEVLDQARLGGSMAWFLSVQGDIEIRRGERGQFLRAYARTELNEGDYVRSGKGGSAEIHFRDQDTVFRLRPSSLIKLARDLGANAHTLGFIEYGWVALDTAEIPSVVDTPYSSLRAEEHTQVAISLEEGREDSRIRVSSGNAEVRDKRNDQVRSLTERQEVRQTARGFSATINLPPHPVLDEPLDGFSINIDTTDRVRLSWNAVPGAGRYLLQVSKSRLFGENLIDDSNRTSTSATLGLREEGNYSWRVAAFDRTGNLGPWSEIRKFRVASYRDLALEQDEEAPVIDVDVLLNGNIALIQGSTEPGAKLVINNEEVSVLADGTFTTTRTLYGPGRVTINFVSTDRSGNRSTLQRHVFVE